MYALILDFEATCDRPSAPNPQEIIEFPTVLLDLTTNQVVDTFESFVQPVHHGISAFCTELTSITSADVVNADEFPQVLQRYSAWLEHHNLTVNNALLVTCGDWDLNRMLPAQLRTSQLGYVHPLLRRWLNIKKLFAQFFPKQRAGMAKMLRLCGIELVGHHHRGIDDCHNISRLLIDLLQRGGTFEATRELNIKQFPPVIVELSLDNRTKTGVLSYRALQTLKGLATTLFQDKCMSFSLNGHPVTEANLLELHNNDRIIAHR